ncbi:hypothetical protein SMC26_27960 [Actinomadura fulvescens]|uniref:Uncharacterized protein n=1 Tax=Actinomadura fulvescens TaxID=46160 RepID=A0ABN3PAG4_9ACTN
MLATVLPSAKAAAVCWTDWCCNGKFCRTCCYHDHNGQTSCGSFDYC